MSQSLQKEFASLSLLLNPLIEKLTSAESISITCADEFPAVLLLLRNKFRGTIIVPSESVKRMLKNFLDEAAEPKIVLAPAPAAVPGDVPAPAAVLPGDDLIPDAPVPAVALPCDDPIPAVADLIGDTIVLVSDASDSNIGIAESDDGTKSASNNSSSTNSSSTTTESEGYIEPGDHGYVWPMSDDEGAEYPDTNIESEGDGDGFYYPYEEE